MLVFSLLTVNIQRSQNQRVRSAGGEYFPL